MVDLTHDTLNSYRNSTRGIVGRFSTPPSHQEAGCGRTPTHTPPTSTGPAISPNTTIRRIVPSKASFQHMLDGTTMNAIGMIGMARFMLCVKLPTDPELEY